MKVHNKIVRDKIPEIIESQGQSPNTRILSEEEALDALVEKLFEEANEFSDDRNLEELADLLEVIQSLAELLGHTPEDLEARKEKAFKRGGFKKRIYLLGV